MDLQYDQFEERHHTQQTKLRILRVTAMERSMANLPILAYNEVLGCTNLTVAKAGYHMNKQVVLVN